uniref:Pseudouridine synthase RsuA/RluA-like domain-containing protein n=1 Tax=Chromera velia CCMP2878 TaxID=1169474 RepID=A0A0G4G1J7_9ALVE|eukprot:Cvel_19816.t1-p1 / transcript=Cvel_19816.t1 / gene=Cvel_19816 / organism=Chromera_velia_CCMP2878 / gene_product=Bifunctional protein RIB2, putative / transcript_product=Bifunctional protein RIB2, putative / location=Cvel_scaffold1734:28240-31718(-) / protein_length=698 / sequence_SO=supercontig / SO=protein_coding / is_pseudo=false
MSTDKGSEGGARKRGAEVSVETGKGNKRPKKTCVKHLKPQDFPFRIVNNSHSIPIRIVEPYEWTFQTYVKGRWLGKTVLDVFTTEFCAYSEAYYREAMKAGRILLNGEPCAPSTLMRDNCLLEHRAVIQEPPILDVQVRVIGESPDLLAVDKPASVPCHPTGTYRFNSLPMLIELQLGRPRGELHCLHRLDRLTSGVVLMGKSVRVAREFSDAFENAKGSGKELTKVYLARVSGDFSEVMRQRGNTERDGCQLIPPNKKEEDFCKEDSERGWTQGSSSSSSSSPSPSPSWEGFFEEILGGRGRRERIRVTGRMVCVNRKVGRHEFFPPACVSSSSSSSRDRDPGFSTELGDSNDNGGETDEGGGGNGGAEEATGKEAETDFEFLCFSKRLNESLIKCTPLTGRTHQIRATLLFLGVPISNDPAYNADFSIEAAEEASKRLLLLSGSQEEGGGREKEREENEGGEKKKDAQQQAQTEKVTSESLSQVNDVDPFLGKHQTKQLLSSLAVRKGILALPASIQRLAYFPPLPHVTVDAVPAPAPASASGSSSQCAAAATEMRGDEGPSGAAVDRLVSLSCVGPVMGSSFEENGGEDISKEGEGSRNANSSDREGQAVSQDVNHTEKEDGDGGDPTGKEKPPGRRVAAQLPAGQAPDAHATGIFLHALAYEWKNRFAFRSSPPDWAQDILEMAHREEAEMKTV